MEDINFQDKIENKDSISTKLQFGKITRSGSVMENRMSERRMD